MKNLEDAKIALPSKLDSSQPPPLIQPLTCYNMDPYGFQKLTSEGVALSLKLQGPASTPLLSSHQAWILWTNILHDFLSYNLHHSQVLFNTGPHHELTRACTAFERECPTLDFRKPCTEQQFSRGERFKVQVLNQSIRDLLRPFHTNLKYNFILDSL